MRNGRFGVLAFVIPAFAAIVACSGADDSSPTKSPGTSDSSGEKKKSDETGSQSADITSAPPPAKKPAPAPSAVPYDAGARDASPPPAPTTQAPPQQTTHFCQELSKCCSQLGALDQVACRGTAAFNDETACGAELAVCAGGGFSGIGDAIGGLFGGGTGDTGGTGTGVTDPGTFDTGGTGDCADFFCL